ncbi:MAG TPA: hypothetical protein VNI20_03750 [Fimbriimonadaceae bacterium]|nr:hypothetical protein [Fimbriimonadaceae bacterium]
MATEQETRQRGEVLEALLRCIETDETIRLPEARGTIESETAMLNVGIEPNAFGGRVGGFRYQFEGEDDLLHLFIVRLNGSELSVEEAQGVVEFLLPGVPSSLIWLKPGRLMQHFYMGHDDFASSVDV